MPSDLNLIIARNLKHYREKAGLTQEGLARAVGELSTGAVSAIEQGKNTPRIDTLKRIADALGVTVDKLLKE